MQRDIKFDLIYKGETRFHHKKYHLSELMRGIGKICDIHHMMDLVAARQFTGLKDVNGVEIYEGDLIKATSRENPSESMAIFKVHYDQVYGSFVGHVVKKIFPVLSPSNWAIGELRFDAEVIGNIYENPELLGEAK